jgi:hyaluronate lyase
MAALALAVTGITGITLLFSSCLAVTDSGAFWDKDLFQVMKDRQTAIIIGTANDPAYTNIRKDYVATAQKYLAAINPEFKYVAEPIPTLNWLWTKAYGKEGDPDYVVGLDFETLAQLEPLTNQYARLETLAAAYSIEGQPLYHSDVIYNIIVKGLPVIMKQGLFDVYTDWETDKKNIYPGLGAKYGWYEWAITIPRHVGNILILMLDYLPPETTALWAGYAHKYAGGYRNGPDYSWGPGPGVYLDWALDGANNADMQTADIVLAIAYSFGPDTVQDGRTVTAKSTANKWLMDAKHKLEKDRILYPEALKSNWAGSTEALANGPYVDGSYIYHADLGYIGSYGGDALTGMAKIANGPVTDTGYGMPKNMATVFIDWAPGGIIPLLWGGKVMSIVNGRSVVRTTSHGKGKEYDNGRSIIAELAKLVEAIGTPEQQRKVIAPLKYNVQKGYHYFDNYATTTSEERGRIVTGLLNGTFGGKDIKPERYTGMTSFGAMDKVVQHINDYAVALGLSSTRIAAYEWSNSENLKGWFQGDGTVWVYNYDWGQFTQNYPSTVDPMHLPGVTNSMAAPPAPPTAPGTQTIKGGSAHAGGVTDGTTGAAAMILNKDGVQARKSWFLLDGAIVSLGAGIAYSGGEQVHTTVENRELTDGIGQAVVSPPARVSKGSHTHVGAVSGQPATGIGYVFLDSANVTAGTETNDKQLKEIYNIVNENIRYQASYFKMYISHGANPNGAAYAYLTLPGKSASETAAYAANVDSHITILSNTADIQAVEAGNIVALSVFSSSGGSVTASGGTYRVDKPALVQVKKLDGSRYSIAVSYPLHAEGTVTLTLPFAVTATRVDSGVSVNGNTVTVSSNNIGSSYTAEVTRSN